MSLLLLPTQVPAVRQATTTRLVWPTRPFPVSADQWNGFREHWNGGAAEGEGLPTVAEGV